MGVPGLIPFLKQRAPGAFARLRAEDLRGSRVGVDLSIVLCRGLAVAFDAGEHYYLELLARQVHWFRGLGCSPVYVVDGASPPEKNEEKQRRRSLRQQRLAKIVEARERVASLPNDAAEQECLEKLERGYFEVRPEHQDAAAALLSLLGAPIVRAAGEAERTLAHMQRAGRVDHVFTEDVDVLLCGATSYVKNAASLQRGDGDGGGEALVVRAREVLLGLDLSYDAFVALGVLAGCDFAPKIARMGPATAYKLLLAKRGSLEECLESLPGVTESVRSRHLRARELLSFDERFELPPVAEASPPDCAKMRFWCESRGLVALRQVLERLFGRGGGAAHDLGYPAKRSRVESLAENALDVEGPQLADGGGRSFDENLGRSAGDDVQSLADLGREALPDGQGSAGESGPHVSCVEAQGLREELPTKGRKRARSPALAEEVLDSVDRGAESTA